MFCYHLGRHLEYLKMFNDDKVPSVRFINAKVKASRINQEKKALNLISRFKKHMLFICWTILVHILLSSLLRKWGCCFVYCAFVCVRTLVIFPSVYFSSMFYLVLSVVYGCDIYAHQRETTGSSSDSL